VIHLRSLALALGLIACVVQGVAPGSRSSAEARSAWEAELVRLSAVLKTLPTDFDRTTFLREYTGALADIGRPDAGTNPRYVSPSFESLNPAELYSLFKQDRLPAMCGLTSLFYIKLLERLGFKAYQYSFGFTAKPYERFIHSVALVEIDVRGTKRLIVQDPYLNVTYRTSLGEPFDFFELLAALKRKEYAGIVMDGGSVGTMFLARDPSLYQELTEGCRAMMAARLLRPDGSMGTSFPITRDYATLMQTACGGFERDFVAALAQNGYPEPLIYAYTLRASDIVGAPDRAQVEQRIDRVLR
jgi:hypothetical protein